MRHAHAPVAEASLIQRRWCVQQTRRPVPVKGALVCLTETLRAVGTSDFYPVLAARLCPLFGCVRYLAMRYARNLKPAFLFNRSFSSAAGQLYMNGLYENDPLYRTVRRGVAPRVFTLCSVDGRVRVSSYRAALLRHAQISDELAIVLPMNEDTAIALCFNQGAGTFNTSTISLAHDIYPVITELNRLHQGHFTRNVRPNPRRHASGGRMGCLVRRDADPILAFREAYRLSPRESELLDLTLEGLANRAIASRLRLAVGTVKNYKRRLYSKFGVCSERAMLRRVADFGGPGHAVSMGARSI